MCAHPHDSYAATDPRAIWELFGPEYKDKVSAFLHDSLGVSRASLYARTLLTHDRFGVYCFWGVIVYDLHSLDIIVEPVLTLTSWGFTSIQTYLHCATVKKVAQLVFVDFSDLQCAYSLKE